MDKTNYYIFLYDFYGNLLNEKQQQYFEYYYFDNLSLKEISDLLDVSRNAIHKSLKMVEKKLDFYESKLNLYEKREKLDLVIDKLDDSIKNKIKEIY